MMDIILFKQLLTLKELQITCFGRNMECLYQDSICAQHSRCITLHSFYILDT
jgi:hypothetical protein